jgi:TonB family protein
MPTPAAQVAQSEPVPVEMPPPRYPPGALRARASGDVLLQVQVDARGLPADVEVLRSSGSRELDRAAVTATRRWRFRPAQRDGAPVAGTVNVPIRFETGR